MGQSLSVRSVAKVSAILGEGPVWVPDEISLYWVDMLDPDRTWARADDGYRVANGITINLPVQRPSSCAFGGTKLDQLYVTSASIGIGPSERTAQPCAGNLIMLDTGFTGLAEVPFEG